MDFASVVKKSLVVTDPAIVDFYDKHPNLDFTQINHIIMDILKQLSTGFQETLSNQILHSLTDLSKEVASLKQDVFSQLHTTKNEYLENIKLILSNHHLTTHEKSQYFMEKNTELLLSKTTNLLNEIMPKHHTTFDDTLKNLHTSILTDTQKIMSLATRDDKVIQEFIANMDTKFNHLISNIQQPLFTCIQQTDDRTSSHLQSLRDKLITQQTSQDTLHAQLHEFLNKYKHNSSSKGNVSEHELNGILQHLFPSDEILDCSTNTATCDYRVNRLHPNKPTILFENKDYTRAVTTEEVKKFERDLALQRQHGIFISQHSNITFKEPFQIDIIDGYIHLYLPNTNYNVDKIRVAVEMIDQLSASLAYIQQSKSAVETTIHINQTDMDAMLELYHDFQTQKNNLVETIRASNKTILDHLDALQLGAIKGLLLKNGIILSNQDDFRCKFCNNFTGKNKASLAAHSRNCKYNPLQSKPSGADAVL